MTVIGLIPGSIGETSTFAVMIGAGLIVLTGVASHRVLVGGLIGMVMSSIVLYFFGSLIGSTNPMMYPCCIMTSKSLESAVSYFPAESEKSKL